MGRYISLFRLPQQNTTDWVTQTTEIYFFTILNAESPRSRYHEVWFLVRPLLLACRWLPSSCFLTWPLPWFLASSGILWFVDGCLLLVSFHHLPSVCVCLCVQISLFHKDSSHSELGPTLIVSTQLDQSGKTLFPRKVTLQVLRMEF